MCSIVTLCSQHILHLLSPHIQHLFSLSSFPHLNLTIIFPSLTLSLHRYSRISSVIHLSYSLLYLDSLIIFLLSCLSVSLSLLLSSTFIHLPLLSIFPHLHWHTRSSGSISPLSPSSPCSFTFLSSIPLVSGTLPFHSFCPQTLPLSFPRSLSANSSCTLPKLYNLAFLCPLLAPISNIFHALSLPSVIPSIPRPLPRTSVYSLSYPQNIIILLLTASPHCLSSIPHTHPLPYLLSSLSL
jgi:hypothetical protein